jgi:hypothetical protein
MFFSRGLLTCYVKVIGDNTGLLSSLCCVCQVRDQWCCAVMRDMTYVPVYSPELSNNLYVVELRCGCGNRASWQCGVESGGPNCCNSYQPGSVMWSQAVPTAAPHTSLAVSRIATGAHLITRSRVE